MSLQGGNITASNSSRNKNRPLPILQVGMSYNYPVGSGNEQMDPSDRVIYEPCSVAYSKHTLRSMKHERKKSASSNQKKIQICFLGKFITVLGFVSSLVTFVLIAYNYFGKSWSVESSLPYHETEYEGPLLLMQSTIGILSLCVITSIVAFRSPEVPISSKCYFLIVFTVIFLAITDGIWVCFEMRHSHNFQLTLNETLTFQLDVESYYDHGPPLPDVPNWMNKIQIEHNCCGTYGPNDWQGYLSGASDIPDSCCVTKSDGCGKNYFLDVAENRSTVKVFTQGCATSQSRLDAMDYRDLNFIIAAKFMETIYLVMYSFVVIFCINSFGDALEEESYIRPSYFPKPGDGFTVA